MECYAADKKNEAILWELREKNLQNTLSEKKNNWTTCCCLGLGGEVIYL